MEGKVSTIFIIYGVAMLLFTTTSATLTYCEIFWGNSDLFICNISIVFYVCETFMILMFVFICTFFYAFVFVHVVCCRQGASCRCRCQGNAVNPPPISIQLNHKMTINVTQ